MAIRDMLMSAAGNTGSAKLYSDDVFSAYTYTGNGSTQTINNGIDLLGSGGLVWTKDRTSYYSHSLIGTVQGSSKNLSSDTTSAAATNTDRITAFNSNGFSLGSSSDHNASGDAYISWTFRKSPKFFDVIAWTGDGVSLGTIKTHSLTQTPGTVFVKCTSAASDWYVWHRGTSSGNFLKLNTTDAQSTTLAASFFGNGTTTVDPTSSGITVGVGLNAMSATYIAYFFSHDTSADGLIQCGSFTAGASASVSLGFEPQFLLLKNVSAAANWGMFDASRGLVASSASGVSKIMNPNTTALDSEVSTTYITATGFTHSGGTAGNTIVYMAIRRPNKTPTSGTQVYNGVTGNTSNPISIPCGFTPDVVGMAYRGSGGYLALDAKLPQTRNALYASPESGSSYYWDNMLGITSGSNSSAEQIRWFLKRAPGFMDMICYKGTGVAHTEAHSLGVVPEMLILKGRSSSYSWAVWHKSFATSDTIFLESDLALQGGYSDILNSTAPTSTVVSLGTNVICNESATNALIYLFATLPGISKVGSYSGNGSSQTIGCGFTSGARFILIKRTNNVGDWYCWDTARGIVAANDPHLSWNTTSTVAEVTNDDSIDPDSSGFIVNQLSATNINTTGATYIFLAIA